MRRSTKLRYWKRALCTLAVGGCTSLSGCMGTYSGQNLPSAYYLNAQVQYFPPGNQFKLTNEAEAQKEYRETQPQQPGQLPPPTPLPPQPGQVQ
jgi:hypothetical protein